MESIQCMDFLYIESGCNCMFATFVFVGCSYFQQIRTSLTIHTSPHRIPNRSDLFYMLANFIVLMKTLNNF